MPADLAPLEPYRDRLAILSGYDVKLDGVPNKPHITGCLGLRTGVPVPNEEVKAPTLDVLISDKRSEEHTSELQSLMRISYAVFCLKKKKKKHNINTKNKRSNQQITIKCTIVN